jgi:N-acetylneuraminate synthase
MDSIMSLRYQKPVVVAEVGCNHKGDFEIAKTFIRTAKEFCDVDIVKFQKRTVNELLTQQEYESPHPNPMHSYGKTYGEHREVLEFNLEQHRELKRYCDELGIGYGCSVWDITAAKEILSLEPAYLKIPSATNTNFDLLNYVCDHYAGEVHISVGMTTNQEENAIVALFEEKGRARSLILYSCTSGYPVPPEDVCLLEIRRLIKSYQSSIGGIGFSGHHNGICIDVAAYTLGAQIVERHFTLDRTWKGTDHSASLEPDGLRKLARDLRNVHKALRYKEQEILEIESAQRKKLKWKSGPEHKQ